MAPCRAVDFRAASFSDRDGLSMTLGGRGDQRRDLRIATRRKSF
jgi:hypothetical protein